jgi:ubiquinone/menaquinone biosynthesis C-methylase UbiE
LLLDGKLTLAPIKKDIEVSNHVSRPADHRRRRKLTEMQRVLDVGTGTGIWAIDFADEYPNTAVLGTDLSPIQPSMVPPNCRFEIDDARDEWTYPNDYFDFIHIRSLFGSIGNWNELYKQVYT